MSIEVGVPGQPPQVGPVGTNDVDLQATEAVPQREGIDVGSSVTVALENDPMPVARPMPVVVEPRTVDDQSELPALEIEDAETGTPGLQRVHFPNSGAARNNRENDSLTLGRPLRTVQERRIRGEERARRAGIEIDGKNGRPTRAVGRHGELVSIGRPRRTAERNRIREDSSETGAI